jgi:transcriptional regulator GlxA family with amidase domain
MEAPTNISDMQRILEAVLFAAGHPVTFERLSALFSISQDGAGIKTINGLRVVPDYGFADHPPVDILVIPGGFGTRAAVKDAAVLDWVKRVAADAKIAMSVCSGARLLGAPGFLDGLEAVTHHTVIESLREIAPAAIIETEKRFTDNGKFMTSGGISAGIDLALHIVRKLHGDATVNKTIKYMEYGDWRSL